MQFKKIGAMLILSVFVISFLGMVFPSNVSFGEDDTTGTLRINMKIKNGFEYSNTISYFTKMVFQLHKGNYHNTYIVEPDDWTYDSTNKQYYVEYSDVPNGDYSLYFVHYESSYEDHINMNFEFENRDFSIDGNLSEVNLTATISTKHNYYMYYKDWSGHNSQIKVDLRLYPQDAFKYNYEKDSEGNNVYTFSTDGNVSEITVVDGERTIVKDLPYASSGSYRVRGNLYTGGQYIQHTHSVITESSNTTKDYFCSIFNSTYFPEKNDSVFYLEYIEKYRAMNLTKEANDGTVANADFVLKDEVNQGKIALFDHYDTYEFEGKEFSNVYVLNGKTADDGGIISTIDGNATIIFPVLMLNDGNYYRPSKYSLYEVNADEGLLFYKDTKMSEYIGMEYPKASTYRGTQISTLIGSVPPYNLYEYISSEDFTNGFVSTTQEGKTNLTNYKKPSVTKIVLNENGEVDSSCQDTFYVGLYDSEFKLISKVEVKANETAYFDVQMQDASKSNYYSTDSTYYIMELENKEYFTKDIYSNSVSEGEIYDVSESDDISEKVYPKAFKYISKSDESCNVVFVNAVISTEIEIIDGYDDEANGNEKGKDIIADRHVVDDTAKENQKDTEHVDKNTDLAEKEISITKETVKTADYVAMYTIIFTLSVIVFFVTAKKRNS